MTDDRGAAGGWVDPSGQRPPQPPPPWPGRGLTPPAAPYVGPHSPYAPPVLAQPGWAQPGWPPGFPPGPRPGPPRPGPPRPRAAWFAVPAVIGVLSAVLFAVFLASHLADLRVAGSDERIGPASAGLRVRMAEGHRYFVFQPFNEVPADVPTCSLRNPDSERPLRLSPPSADDDWTYDESRQWSLLGSFRAPVTTKDTEFFVACDGLSGDMLVRPDDSVFGTLVGAVVLTALGLLAAVVLVVVLAVMRYRSLRRPGGGW